MKILILGGYGVFGGRLVALLSDVPALELLVCGRDLRRAERFCAGYGGKARVRPVRLDRRDIAPILRAVRPDLVVDASGPFQDYGADRYGVITACIAARIDYLDFADAAGFVAGVSQFDAQARAAGVFVLSGVSSFPVLSAAVLREMARTMDIVSVEGGIAPSPFAGIGLNVMRAVLSSAGAPVMLRRSGRDARAIGFAESRRFTIAVPGRVPLGSRRFSLVDVPDLRVIPAQYPALTDIWMGAGPLPDILLRLLNLLARARLPLVPFARLFHGILDRMRFGEHRGGMIIRARGVRDGVAQAQSWHLLAEGDDGPRIPSMAIEGVIRALLAGRRPPPGARPGTDALTLAEYEALFAGRTIYTGFRRDGEAGGPFRRVLGPAFRTLPPRVQAVHARPGCWAGTAEVRRGQGLMARALAWIIGFPPAASAVPVRVTIAAEGDGERWTRDFAGRTFSSFLGSGRGRDDGLLVERFGIISVGFALVVRDENLCLVSRRWSCLGLPLPKALRPGGRMFETEVGGQFAFDVEIAMPLIGLVVAYRGVLRPG